MKILRYLPLLLLFALLTAADKPFVSENDHLTMAVLYHQQAPEYAALCYQTYNLATARMQQTVRKKGSAERLAVVMDLDETVLDNSPYEAKCITDNIRYPAQWKEWCMLAKAEAIPGAVEFILQAQKLGVQVIYISNRKEEFREATKNNLQSLGIPVAKDEDLLLRIKENEKESRRKEIAARYEVILLIGDNLNDFSDIFETARGEDRKNRIHDQKKSFGEKYIILPNAIYGDWEQALYTEPKMTPEQQRAARYRGLKRF
ncbi:MAG TPA: 5'-nucleotidase, lipoprotein e(P4) family [Bacteroidales bacterium]|nr:5'-nucleotidase, lipoprotein e(P4) family [Bacteroidales bacterium]HRZ50144.1 5'-nucleotidase, lipoprotein e(P4) family [Bacteroidales bacterium]